APARKLFDLVKVGRAEKKGDGKEYSEIPEKPARSFEDYTKIDFADVKSKAEALGVEAIEML
ncbi:MAG: hypothetical protein KKE00_09690, partial [Proteobacteria bacterium]|nr:hypothetical protein [Pseudomonadota bacterium]